MFKRSTLQNDPSGINMILRDFKVYPFTVRFAPVYDEPDAMISDQDEALTKHAECWEKAFEEYKALMAAVKLKSDHTVHLPDSVMP